MGKARREHGSVGLGPRSRQGAEATDIVTTMPARGLRAFELLAAQPISLIGLTIEQRRSIVITAIADDAGKEHVVSRFEDDVWDFQGVIGTQNVMFNERFLHWPTDVPCRLVDDAKAAMYVWWKQGRPGWKSAKAKSVINAVRQVIPTLRYLASVGVRDFGAVRPIHLADYLQQLRGKGLADTGSYHKLLLIDVALCFGAELLNPLVCKPWGRSSLLEFCGLGGSKSNRGVSKTPLIPPSVQARIFNHAEGVLARADEILEQRAGTIIRGSNGDGRDTELRDAVLFLLLMSTGMRNSEAMGVKNGAWRSEVKNGVTYHWVQTIEHKTGKGLVGPAKSISVVQACASV